MFYTHKVAPIIRDWKAEAKVKYIVLYRVTREGNEYNDAKYKVTICTNSPGPFIGMRGTLIDKYTTKLQEALGHAVFVQFVETDGIV